MIYWISVYMSFSVCIAAIIAAVRFRSIDLTYLPFILCIWIGAVNEVLSFTAAQNGFSNIPNNNIYVLIEGILICWQFQKWGLLKNIAFFITVSILVLMWVFEIHSLKTLQNLHYYYRLLYGTVVIICSISFSNTLIISHRIKLITHPGFVICTGYILYFTLKIVSDTWWLLKPVSSNEFLMAVFVSMSGVNFLTNILFILAIIWMPRKPNYITF